MPKKISKHSASAVIRRWNLRLAAIVLAAVLTMAGLCAWVAADTRQNNRQEQTALAASEAETTEQTDETDAQNASESEPADAAAESAEESADAQDSGEFSWTEEEITPTQLFITEDGARLRSTPNFEDSENTIKCLSAGTSVIVVAETNLGYYKCDESMYFGYVSAEYVTADSSALPFTWTEVAGTATKVATDTVNQRSEPRTSADVVGQISSGTTVNVVASAEGFYKLEDGSWVYAAYFTDPIAASTTKTTTSTASSASSASASTSAASSSSAASVVNDGTVSGILNSAPLSPRSTGYASTDAKIQEIFSSILNDSMSTYEKVKACYDYIIYHTSYARGAYVSSAGFGSPKEGNNDAYIAWGALSCLSLGKGSCNTYSCAFIAMVRTIGLDAAYVSGSTHASGGGYTGHNWVEVYIGGQTYVFDPQVEDNISGGGTYNRFCKTYAQLPGKYIK